MKHWMAKTSLPKSAPTAKVKATPWKAWTAQQRQTVADTLHLIHLFFDSSSTTLSFRRTTLVRYLIEPIPDKV